MKKPGIKISLRLKFTGLFILLGAAIALAVGIPYNSYVESSYMTTLSNVVTLVKNETYWDSPEIIRNRGLINSDEYWELHDRIKRIISTFDLAYIYCLVPLYNEGRLDTLQYILSSEDSRSTPLTFKRMDDPGDPEIPRPEMLSAIETQEMQLAPTPVTTQFGTLVSAFLPIMRDGRTVALLGADYDIRHVNEIQQQVLFILIGVIILIVIFAIFLAFYITAPLKELELFSGALANARFDAEIKRFRTDELGDMQHSLVTTRDELKKLVGNLQEERDTVTIMQNNLRTGIFLIDKNFVIQGNYSASLEDILSVHNLEGVKFSELLVSSFNESDLGKVKDYFSMVLDGKINQRKLNAINPLDNLNYISTETKEEKVLRCEFAHISRDEEPFILVSIDDITNEWKLRQKLEQEEQRRQEEMRALFEVVHIDPAIFSDFMEDTQQNFKQVTNLLQNQDLDSEEALIQIYQLIHAVKADAIIIGLEDFGNKLHELEKEIKQLSEKGEIVYREMLHLTVDIELVLKEQDKLVGIIERIRTYKGGGKQDQAKYVLIESLRRACNRVAEDTKKKVKFVDDIDGDALQNVSRREVKEILVQLVRNAVYHGIESPSLRAASGKDEAGTVKLSTKLQDGQIHIELTDDGKGLDFDTIRERAEKMHLIKDPKAVNKNSLVKAMFAPGFSTTETADLHAGRGVGLSLVHDRIRSMNGTIQLRTEKGKGTNFIISIPAQQTG
ncbi:hypothetical protein FACS1894151_01790 [Spirochaetia bacterium]|nr:hypothetical protein FACS1894151_01790 [Spirochaetia bacterium]